MDFTWLANPIYQHYLWVGFINTLLLVALSGLFGFILAVLVGLVQITGPRPLAWLARGFTTVIRGTPLLLQLFFFYNGIGLLLPHIPGVRDSFVWPILRDAFFYGFLSFTISVGAYVGEVIRGALLSVPNGELVAARAFGLSRVQILWRIWLPRAIQICLPTLTNELILLLKSVPLVSTISVMDMLGAADVVRDDTFLVYPPLIVIGIVYVVLAVLFTWILRIVEHKFPGRHSALREPARTSVASNRQ